MVIYVSQGLADGCVCSIAIDHRKIGLVLSYLSRSPGIGRLRRPSFDNPPGWERERTAGVAGTTRQVVTVDGAISALESVPLRR
jgi:hypothetical protein